MVERADKIDVHVGKRLRLRRNLLGMSQEKLGQEVGLTFQQIQKYERGANRIGASRLYQFSTVLDVPISFFYDDIPSDLAAQVAKKAASAAQGFSEGVQSAYETEDNLHRKETLELIRSYFKIPDIGVRRRVYDLVKSVGSAASSR